MKVALTFPGCHRRGGVERVMVEAANYLHARGHEVHVFASTWDPACVAEAVVRHDVPAWNAPPLLRLATYARNSQRSLGRAGTTFDAHGSFGVISPPGGVYWAQSVHRAWLEVSRSVRGFRGRLKQRLNPVHPYLLSRERWYVAGRRYRKLIALTDQVKVDLTRWYGAPDEDVVVLPNGYAPAEFGPAGRARVRPAMRAELCYKPDDKVVAFVANELERKGFGPLLRAVASLNDPAVHLLAVGRLNGGTTYADEIRRLGMGGRVRFTGPSDRVADYYAAADVFGLPTQYEPWGLVIVEAMACGLPALTSRVAGAAVAVRDGETGMLLDDPNDPREIAGKLRPLLAGRHAPPDEIARSVRVYEWPNVLRRYEQILEECAEHRSPVGARPAAAGEAVP